MARAPDPFRFLRPAHGRLRAWRVTRGAAWEVGDGAGRWHRAGDGMLYASATAALAVLEARAHLEPGDARRRHRLDCFCAVLRPGEAWCIDPAALPADWKRSRGWTRAVGSGWLATGQGAALLVPSVLAPGELNVLLNPRHPAFQRWIRDSVRQDLRFDARLLRLG